MCGLGVHGARCVTVVTVTRNQAQRRKEMAQMRGSSETSLILCNAWEPGMSTVITCETKVNDMREMEI